jgi:mono/diheme cytochrome c family protein
MSVDRRIPVVIATVLFVMLVSSCGGSGDGPSSAPQSPTPTGALAHDTELLRGRTVFQDNCAECHGFNGEGGVGPTFNDGKLLRDFPTVDAQAAFVEQGKGAMPSFSGTLNAAQIHAVVRYEREVLSQPPR